MKANSYSASASFPSPFEARPPINVVPMTTPPTARRRTDARPGTDQTQLPKPRLAVTDECTTEVQIETNSSAPTPGGSDCSKQLHTCS